jgi:hypothetical protein
MTVAEIERIGAPQIAPGAARRAFRDYRKAALAEKNAALRADYEALTRGYRAIASGKQVIDLHQVMKAAGVNESFYPRLAIARADGQWCHLSLLDNGGAHMTHVQTWTTRRGRRPGHVVALPANTFPRVPQWSPGQGYSGRPRGWSTVARAMVPMVPPQYHPGAALSNYFILWDAVWEPAPPVDPLLMKHLGGALYAIVAAWDLTPLEQAVMRGRLG